jgi:hypothetical protein
MSQAITSLNREISAVLVGEEAANIGRTIAQIIRGDGWMEARSSAVLTDAIATWLGRDKVKMVGFYSNGSGPLEVIARAGNYLITARGIESESDATINCCERHRARFSESRLDGYDLKSMSNRFNWGTPLTQRAADRLAALLAEEIDPEIARVVLGVH